MKIVCISDTHEQEDKLIVPDGDILIHSGDLTYKGSMPKLAKAADWFKSLPHKHKICVAGNHDFCFENLNHKDAVKLMEDAGVIYLQDSGIQIEELNIWGSPITPFFFDWAFNRQRGKDIKVHWDKIPDNTNVLITHGPPYMIRDEAPRGVVSHENVGCVDLLNRIGDLDHLVLHVFGHIHHGYGVTKHDRCSFVNASSCTESYSPINPPIVIEL
jgi:Icc-related predicted phosphoesterase